MEWYRNGNWVGISREDGIWVQNSLGTICVVPYGNYQDDIDAEDAAVAIIDMLAEGSAIVEAKRKRGDMSYHGG